MKKISIIPLMLGLMIGGVAIKLGLDTLQKAKASGQTETVTTIVATADIPATAPIERMMVREVATPRTPLLDSGCFTKVDDLVGRVAAFTIPRGSVIREPLLTPKGTPPGLAVRIKSGYRAVSVKVNEVTGVAYQIQPGAFVDVIAVMTINKGRRRETISRIILQDIEVAAVGRTLNAPNSSDGAGKVAKSVTLLVRDSDAPRLHLAQTRGKLTLALRSSEDKLLNDNPGETTEGDLLGEKRPTIHKPTRTNVVTQIPVENRSVLIVNGDVRQEREFEADGGIVESGDSRPAPVSHRRSSRPTNPGRVPSNDAGGNDEGDGVGSGLSSNEPSPD